MGELAVFPVRHHSPAVALALRDFIRARSPAAVLVEGPSDFNPFLEELFAPHVLPVAIYSYAQDANGGSAGAYYPFCEHSPEWVAFQEARAVGADCRFIDLPWTALRRLERAAAEVPEAASRYSDRRLGRSRYVESLCRELGVDDFDALWDELFEIEPFASPEELIERCAAFCSHCRALEALDPVDDAREAFMAARIAESLDRTEGLVLVVAGGFHAEALLRRTAERDFAGPADAAAEPAEGGPAIVRAGINLTPYSDERLDRLRNYGAGMPGPGYYRQVWRDRSAGRPFDHRVLGRAVVDALRARGQHFSAADLIAAEAASSALALIRGHAAVWRRDLADGFRTAIVKDELQREGSHPLLDAIAGVFRGQETGRLAAGVRVPPLALEIRECLANAGLEPKPDGRRVELDLGLRADLAKSRILHRLGLLGVRGVELVEGTDLAARDDLSEVRELWGLRWTPDFEASLIDASRFGATLEEAAVQALAEKAEATRSSAAATAALLIEAALAGLGGRAARLASNLGVLLGQATDFLDAAAALDHLLYLALYDRVLEFEGAQALEPLIARCWQAALYLLESMGNLSGKDRELLDALASLDSALRRCPERVGLSRDELVAVMERVRTDRGRRPLVRGAATALLWNWGALDRGMVLAGLRLFSTADLAGDFLTGLFALGRETVQKNPEIMRVIDELVTGFTPDEFIRSLPALRLAFSWFTSREKHALAGALAGTAPDGAAGPDPRPSLLEAFPASREEILAAMDFERRLFAMAARYGILDGEALDE